MENKENAAVNDASAKDVSAKERSLKRANFIILILFGVILILLLLLVLALFRLSNRQEDSVPVSDSSMSPQSVSGTDIDSEKANDTVSTAESSTTVATESTITTAPKNTAITKKVSETKKKTTNTEPTDYYWYYEPTSQPTGACTGAYCSCGTWCTCCACR